MRLHRDGPYPASAGLSGWQHNRLSGKSVNTSSFCKLAESMLCPVIQMINEDVMLNWSMQLVSGLQLDFMQCHKNDLNKSWC